jgi:CRP-like cAMP-binding protein
LSVEPPSPADPSSSAEAARVQALRGVPLFEDLTEDELRLLAGRCDEQSLSPNARIFQEGDAGDGLYVIQAGVVVIVRDRVGEPVQRLARLGSGGFFGEMGLLDGSPRTATAIASESSVLLHVRTQDLLQLFKERPLLAIKLRTAIIRRHGENVVSALELSGRRELRTRIDAEVELGLPGGGVHATRLENLSRGGAGVRNPPADWQLGREVHFDLRLPGGDPLLVRRGRVAWRNERSAGISFEGGDGGGPADPRLAAEEVRRALRRLLDEVDDE